MYVCLEHFSTVRLVEKGYLTTLTSDELETAGPNEPDHFQMT